MPATARHLYRVEATYEYFVIADDEYHALNSGVLREVLDDAFSPDGHTAVPDDGTTTLHRWGPDSLVYSTGYEEMTLEQARARLRGDSDG